LVEQPVVSAIANALANNAAATLLLDARLNGDWIRLSFIVWHTPEKSIFGPSFDSYANAISMPTRFRDANPLRGWWILADCRSGRGIAALRTGKELRDVASNFLCRLSPGWWLQNMHPPTN
jgi:hypothetical protein